MSDGGTASRPVDRLRRNLMGVSHLTSPLIDAPRMACSRSRALSVIVGDRLSRSCWTCFYSWPRPRDRQTDRGRHAHALVNNRLFFFLLCATSGFRTLHRISMAVSPSRDTVIYLSIYLSLLPTTNAVPHSLVFHLRRAVHRVISRVSQIYFSQTACDFGSP